MEEVLFGRIRMTIPDAQFRVSTDSMVLADFCRDAGGRGLDLGCGCGTLGLLLLGSGAAGSVCGIEIQPEAARLEPKRLRFVRHSAASAVSLVLLEARLGGKPGLQIEPELVLYGPDGSESAACRRIYHRQE